MTQTVGALQNWCWVKWVKRVTFVLGLVLTPWNSRRKAPREQRFVPVPLGGFRHARMVPSAASQALSMQAWSSCVIPASSALWGVLSHGSKHVQTMPEACRSPASSLPSFYIAGARRFLWNRIDRFIWSNELTLGGPSIAPISPTSHPYQFNLLELVVDCFLLLGLQCL